MQKTDNKYSQYICQSCWSKTNDFHSFYVTIESKQHQLLEKYGNDIDYAFISKEEYLIDSPLIEAEEFVDYNTELYALHIEEDTTFYEVDENQENLEQKGNTIYIHTML